MDTISQVRLAFHVEGWSMKKILRELHVSRNTVRKIVRSNETDFSYERANQPLPRIGPWQSQLEQFLVSNSGKPSRERLTLIRIFEELRGLGYEGGYDAVRRFARTWSEKRGAATAEAYVPLYYAPGEAYQFDWSHEVVLIAGVTVTVKVAHVRLCHSRMMPSRHCRDSFEDHAQGAWAGPACVRAKSLSHRARTDGATMASIFDAHDPLPAGECVHSPRGGIRLLQRRLHTRDL